MISFLCSFVVTFYTFFMCIAKGVFAEIAYPPKHSSKNGFTYTTVKDVIEDTDYDNRHSDCYCCSKISGFLLH